MRSETGVRLERVIRRRRLIRLSAVGAVALAMVAVMWLEELDLRVENRPASGHVERVAALAGKDSLRGLLVDVALDDGRHVEVVALKSTDPHVGDRVTIIEHRHATGRTTFTWK